MTLRKPLTADEDNVDPHVREVRMEEIATEENMWAAYKRVRRNRGAPGPDGKTVEEVGLELKEQMPSLLAELQGGLYRPGAVRGVSIPKPGGGERDLGIPNVLDRMVQQALLQAMTPVFDPEFSDSSHGFRPGRTAHGALQQVRTSLREGMDWVVNVDLRKFFDRVNHDVLMTRIARKIRDPKVLRLIGRFLRAGMMRGGVISPRRKGTPQGGPLSPLLSNILLDDLDKWLEQRGHQFVRYADDFVILKRSERAAYRTKTKVTQYLERKLRLQVNEEKSSIERPETLVYLGYTFVKPPKGDYKLIISDKAIRRLREQLRPQLTRWGRGRTLKATIEKLGPILRGWHQYFKLTRHPSQLRRLDQWIRRHLRCLLWRRWRTGWTRCKRLVDRGIPLRLARKLASTRHGPWHSSSTPQMSMAFSNAYFHGDLGLFSLLQGNRDIGQR